MPPLLAVRCTMAFDDGEDGWTEVWFRSGDLNLESALSNCLEYGRLRLLMMSDSVRFAAARVSDDLVTGDSLLTIPQAPNTGSIHTASTEPSFSGVEVRVEATSKYRRAIDMRGVESFVTIPPFASSPEYGAWLTAFNSWALFIKARGARWAVRTFTKDPAKIFRVTEMLNDNANPGYVLIFAPGHTFQTGNRFSFLGFPKKKYPGMSFKGTYTVQNVIPNQSFSAFASQFPAGVQYQGGGKVQLKSYIYTQPNDLIPVRYSSHKVGRPFGSSRGRKRVVRP